MNTDYEQGFEYEYHSHEAADEQVDHLFKRARNYYGVSTELVDNGGTQHLRVDPTAWNLCSAAELNSLTEVLASVEAGADPGAILFAANAAETRMLHDIGWSADKFDKRHVPAYAVDNGRIRGVDTVAILRNVVTWAKCEHLGTATVNRMAGMSIFDESYISFTRMKPENALFWEESWASSVRPQTWLGYALVNAAATVIANSQDAQADDWVSAAIVCDYFRSYLEDDCLFSSNKTDHYTPADCFAYGHSAATLMALVQVEVNVRNELSLPWRLQHILDAEIRYWFGYCEEIFMHHWSDTGVGQGVELTAVQAQGAGANSDYIDKSRGLGATALADWLTARLHTEWHHWHVTGWIAATKLARSLALGVRLGALTRDDARRLVEFSFGRNTFRKFICSDQVLDSIRDIQASEITQAATRAVRLARVPDPFVMIMDDLEFAVKHGAEASWKQPGFTYSQAKTMLIKGYSFATRYSDHCPRPRLTEMRTDVVSNVRAQPGVDGSPSGVPLFVKLKRGLYDTATYDPDVEPGAANAVLFSVHKKSLAQPEFDRVILTGEKTPLYHVDIHDCRASYLVLAETHTKLREKYVAHIAGNFYRKRACKYGLPTAEFLADFGAVVGGDEPIDVPTRLAELAIPEITQQHHRHTSLFAVLAAYGCVWYPELNNLLRWEDSNLTFVTTAHLAVSNLPLSLRALMLTWSGWNSASAAEFHKAAKALSVRCKALDNQVTFFGREIDLAPLFEWDTVLNRGFGQFLWADEVRDRRNPDLNIRIDDDVARRHIREFMLDTKRVVEKYGGSGDKSPIRRDWADFMASRARETPAGSSASCDALARELKSYIKAMTGQDVTKTQVMACLPDDMPMSHFTDKARMVVAALSTKFEWGKNRALFAAVLEHYVLCAFTFYGVENYLPANCPVGEEADASRVCRRVMDMARDAVYVCVDAKNFNILHTFKITSMVIEEYVSVFEPHLSAEQREAGAWLAEAELDQRVMMSADQLKTIDIAAGIAEGWIEEHDQAGYLVKLTGGLFSGHRLTMFLNTVLNRVYYNVAAEMCGLHPMALHSGDDVFARYNDIAEALLMRDAFAAINYTLQYDKCFVNSVAEFLRISHKGKSTSQYMARSCATMVHGRIETSSATDMLALVTANARRAAELIVRYGDRPGTLALLMIQNAAVASRWVEPSFAVSALLNTPIALGGMRSLDTVKSIPGVLAIDRTASASSNAVKFFAGTPGVKQAARDLIQELGMDGYYNRAASAIGAGIALKSSLQSYGFRVMWVGDHVLGMMKRMAGRYIHVTQSREYVLSKAAGLFNVLVDEDQRWHGLKHVAGKVHPVWAGLMLSAALTRPEIINQLQPKTGLEFASWQRLAEARRGFRFENWFNGPVMRVTLW